MTALPVNLGAATHVKTPALSADTHITSLFDSTGTSPSGYFNLVHSLSLTPFNPPLHSSPISLPAFGLYTRTSPTRGCQNNWLVYKVLIPPSRPPTQPPNPFPPIRSRYFRKKPTGAVANTRHREKGKKTGCYALADFSPPSPWTPRKIDGWIRDAFPLCPCLTSLLTVILPDLGAAHLPDETSTTPLLAPRQATRRSHPTRNVAAERNGQFRHAAAGVPDRTVSPLSRHASSGARACTRSRRGWCR